MLQTLKKFLLAFVSIFLLSVFSTSVLAQDIVDNIHNATKINFTTVQYFEIGNTIVSNLTNGSTSFNSQLNITFVLNNTAFNVSVWLNNGTYINMTNITGDNRTWTNHTPITFSRGSVKGAERFFNVQFNSTYNNAQQWSNSSPSHKTFNWTFNELDLNESVVLVNNPVNGTTYGEGYFNIQIRTNNTRVSGCTAYIANTTQVSYASLRNDTGRLSFRNASALNTLGQTNNYNLWHNFTVGCFDAHGNYSWSNSSRNIRESPSNFTLISIDTTVARVFGQIYTVGNMSTATARTTNVSVSGNYINYTVTVNETNLDKCWARVYQDEAPTDKGFARVTNSTFNYSSHVGLATRDGSSANFFCYINVTPDIIVTSGNLTIIGFANHSVVNGSSGENQTLFFTEYQVNKMKAGWNSFVPYQNDTLTLIHSYFDPMANVTHISIFDNKYGFKNYTTFDTTQTTNRLIRVNATLNVTFIRVLEDTVVIQLWRDTLMNGAISNEWINQTSLFTGVSASGSFNNGTQNFIANLVRLTMNQTLSLVRLNQNASGALLSQVVNATFMNITDVSYWNATAQLYCSGVRTLLATSGCGSVTATTLTIPRGEAFFVRPNVNNTANTTTVSTPGPGLLYLNGLNRSSYNWQ